MTKLDKIKYACLDLLFSKTTIIYSPSFETSLFWREGDKIVAELEGKKHFWVHYKIWEQFSETFSLQYNEAQDTIRGWLCHHMTSKKIDNIYKVFQKEAWYGMDVIFNRTNNITDAERMLETDEYSWCPEHEIYQTKLFYDLKDMSVLTTELKWCDASIGSRFPKIE